jgi:hypothetical protein
MVIAVSSHHAATQSSTQSSLPERAVALAQDLLAATKANQRDGERDQAQKSAR